MGNTLKESSVYLSQNTQQLRKKQNLSQVQLAELSGIPRSTITYIESGEGNPSLSNLIKLSSALKVSVQELLSRPQVQVRHIKAQHVNRILNKNQNVEVKKILPDPIPGMEIDFLTLQPGARLKGTPHIAQTKEYFYCLSGSITIYLNKTSYILKKGDVLAFPGDLPHAYENTNASHAASGFGVVTYSPIKFL